jgi:ribosomal protein L37AE/L43A
MEDNYNKSISLQCPTCGSECSFETDEKTGVITCKKCNRIYHGGYEELVDLNQRRIDDEMQLLVDEVEADLSKKINKLFENL